MSLQPDLTWWLDGRCVFVGDAKYKDLTDSPDLYQLLAYVTSLDLPGGLLVYAQDEAEAELLLHRVRHSGKRLEVAALDLSGTLDETYSHRVGTVWRACVKSIA